MASLNRMRATWENFHGAPGVSTFYFTDIAGQVAHVSAFFAAIQGNLPSGLQITVEPTGDIIEDTTGAITGTWIDGTAVVETGTDGGGSGPAPTGAVVDWLTSTVVFGRRRRGRTFLVPLGASQYESNGTLSSGAQSGLQAAATALVVAAGGALAIWVRPFPGKPAVPPRAARPAHLGATATVTLAVVPDFSAVLRSRRD